MDKYQVRFTSKFDADLALIEEDQFDFGFAHTQKYVVDLVQTCQLLQTMPNRFEAMTINDKTYRSFSFKAHRVFYQVSDSDQTVYIVSVLHGRQDFKRHL